MVIWPFFRNTDIGLQHYLYRLPDTVGTPRAVIIAYDGLRGLRHGVAYREDQRKKTAPHAERRHPGLAEIRHEDIIAGALTKGGRQKKRGVKRRRGAEAPRRRAYFAILPRLGRISRSRLFPVRTPPCQTCCHGHGCRHRSSGCQHAHPGDCNIQSRMCRDRHCR